MLPTELVTRQKARDHAQIQDMASYIQQTASGMLFMGKNLKPFVETLTGLAEAAQKFDQNYASNHLVPEEPDVLALSSWKRNQQLAEAAG